MQAVLDDGYRGARCPASDGQIAARAQYVVGVLGSIREVLQDSVDIAKHRDLVRPIIALFTAVTAAFITRIAVTTATSSIFAAAKTTTPGTAIHDQAVSE